MFDGIIKSEPERASKIKQEFEKPSFSSSHLSKPGTPYRASSSKSEQKPLEKMLAEETKKRLSLATDAPETFYPSPTPGDWQKAHRSCNKEQRPHEVYSNPALYEFWSRGPNHGEGLVNLISLVKAQLRAYKPVNPKNLWVGSGKST